MAAPPRLQEIIADGEQYVIFPEKHIGRGAYSEVYEGRTSSGRRVAVKTACKRVEILAMRSEVEILQKLKGAPNIVQYIGSVNERMAPGSVPAETFSFAMEFAMSSLDAEMRRPENCKGLPADILIDLVIDSSSALSALHRNNIVHRDIKHMNILLFPGTPTNGRRSSYFFKLCDMGCSKDLLEQTSHEMRTLVGTPNLLHPVLANELADPRIDRNQHDWRTRQPYTPEQVDLWSLGCTLFFCATGKFPFENESNNKRLYRDAAVALTQNPEAIGMTPVGRGVRDSAGEESLQDYEPITELPSKFTRYPRWLVCTMTCIIRQFFHNPSIEQYANVANALLKAKRKTFLSTDQLAIIDHTDMSAVPYIGFSVPSLSECFGYPRGTDLLLISNTTFKYIKSDQKSLEGLNDDVYLVVPQRNHVNVRKILARNIEYHEYDDMTDRKLALVRISKCYDGLSMLTEADEYCRLFEQVAKILATQFNLLEEKTRNFEQVQTLSRFAVYMDILSVPMVLSNGSSSETNVVAQQCIQRANQAREELDRHANLTMEIGTKASQLSKDAEGLLLEETDLPGIREELESFSIYDKSDILATREYSQTLVERCFNRRKSILEQIFKSPDGIRKSKLKQAVDLAASLNKLKAEHEQLQRTILECVDLLERPFQEMKNVVNKNLQERGHSRTSMERSMRFLAPEFREDQKRVKAATSMSRELVEKLNLELKDLNLDFVRLGDTLLLHEESRKRDEDEERTLRRATEVEDTQTVREQRESSSEAACCSFSPPSHPSSSSPPSESSVEATEHSPASLNSSSSPQEASPSSPSNNFFQALVQMFVMQPPPPPASE